MPDKYQPVQFIKYDSTSGWQTTQNGVISEASVSLTVNGQFWLSFMCTPSQQEALAVGFLFNEGIIQKAQEIEIVQTCADGSNVDVWLSQPVEKPAQWRRTSGCTGGVTSDTAQKNTQPLLHPIQSVPPQSILSAMDMLLKAQELYREVRGVHCSILTDGEEIVAIAEDIGRHNTLDKIAGLLLLEPSNKSGYMILTTGRISSEMLQKSARLGAAVVVSRTSPSSFSIQLAEQYGITLIGYARRNQFNVYAHPERLFNGNGQHEFPDGAHKSQPVSI